VQNLCKHRPNKKAQKTIHLFKSKASTKC